MKFSLPILLGLLAKRETPQELSHDRYVLRVKQMLDLNNTIGVADPRFGLLVNDAAVVGMGSVTDPDCLQLSIADLAFTNAKAVNHLEGLVASLIYRALERNTPSVGVASEECTSVIPQNPELRTFKQHQDPASPGAQARNKATVLELARQIALIGGDPSEALFSGTFAPGDLGSTSGNSCNTEDCIFENDLLVREASQAELMDYVAGCVDTVTVVVGRSGSMSTALTIEGSVTRTNTQTQTITSAPTARLSSSTPSSQGGSSTGNNQQTNTQQTQQQPSQTSTTSAQQSQSSSNLQTFTGRQYDIPAPAVTGPNGNGRYSVEGDNSTFDTLAQALNRSCDNQKNSCANYANQNKLPVPPCDTQMAQCKAAAS
ncbi:hypothetical protein CPB86DRAFT_805964 [Serendipita vermifera]|nr:hypothetical protein CPB86DRAFT_805964 [Serendipita vermifera]